MLSREGKQTDRGAVGAEFIGYNRRRREALLLQEFPHQPNCRPSVPAGLNQEIQDFALTVHGTPEIELPPSNYDDHLVQVPAFGRSWPPTLNPPRIGPTEFQDPSSNCLIRDVETTLGKQVLNVPIAQRETAIEPDGMLDDDRWKAVTTVGYLAHPETLKHRPCRSHAVNVTMPIRTLLDVSMPNNAGFYRPIRVTVPERSFLNAAFPAPVGARGSAGYRVRTLVLGALARLLPGRIPACPGGSEFGIVLAGYEEDRKPFLFLEFHNITGTGGGPDRDGQEGGPFSLGNPANVPVEIIEAENPIRIDTYALLPDTSGAGKYRGALGIVRQYRVLADRATVQVRSDRQHHRPFGLFGGQGGSFGRCVLNPGDGAETLPSKFVRTFHRDDVIRGEMPGGGGYGDPLERDPERVAEDVSEGKITVEYASQAYGVIIDGDSLRLDVAATTARRAEMAGRVP